MCPFADFRLLRTWSAVIYMEVSNSTCFPNKILYDDQIEKNKTTATKIKIETKLTDQKYVHVILQKVWTDIKWIQGGLVL